MTDRDIYLRGLLADMRDSVMDLRDTEITQRDVHAAYQAECTGDAAARLIARQRADSDARVVNAARLGAWHRDRAQTFALAYLAERDADRKAQR